MEGFPDGQEDRMKHVVVFDETDKTLIGKTIRCVDVNKLCKVSHYIVMAIYGPSSKWKQCQPHVAAPSSSAATPDQQPGYARHPNASSNAIDSLHKKEGPIGQEYAPSTPRTFDDDHDDASADANDGSVILFLPTNTLLFHGDRTVSLLFHLLQRYHDGSDSDDALVDSEEEDDCGGGDADIWDVVCLLPAIDFLNVKDDSLHSILAHAVLMLHRSITDASPTMEMLRLARMLLDRIWRALCSYHCNVSTLSTFLNSSQLDHRLASAVACHFEEDGLAKKKAHDEKKTKSRQKKHEESKQSKQSKQPKETANDAEGDGARRSDRHNLWTLPRNYRCKCQPQIAHLLEVWLVANDF